MKIHPITTYNNPKYKYNYTKFPIGQNSCREKSSIHYGFACFKGKTIPKLYEEYNWYINCDRLPAINSFLKINASKETMNKFLTEILNTKDRGFEFIESITSQPRKTSNIIEGLKNKLGENSQHLLTFIPNTSYYNAYENFIKRKFEGSCSVMEILKIRPDWRGDKLIEKAAQSGNDCFTIGNIPRQIGKDHLYKIISYLKDKMEIGVKYDKKIDNLIIDGKIYEFKYFTEGKSSKNVFGLFVPSESKKYVVKMDELSKRSLDAPFALGTLAKIDAYLTYNRSRNSAPLCFYDHENNFSVYKYIEHSYVKEDAHNLPTIRKKLPDFKSLGLDYNDNVGYKNFFELNENSLDTHWRMEGFDEAIPKEEWISVDNDHVTYSNRLQPPISGYHSYLPNAMQMFF